MALENDNGGKGWYLILGKDEYEEDPNEGAPIRADSPTNAVQKRGMADYKRIKVYQLREKATTACEYWDGEELEI